MDTRKHYQSYLVVGLATLAVGCTMAMVQYKVPTVMIPIMGQFGLDATAASWLMSILTLMMVFTAIPFGSLAQKVSSKKIIGFATGIIVAGSLLGAFSQSVPLLIASRAIEGVALTAVTTCGPILIQKCVAPERIGSAMGFWGMWGSLGSVLAGLATPTVFALCGFTGLWLAYAVLVIVAYTALCLLVKEPAPEQEIDVVDIERPRYKEVFTKNTMLFFVGFIAFNVTLLAVLSFVPSLLQLKGWDATLSGFVSTLPMMLSIVSAPVFGILSDKTGKAKALLVLCLAFLGPTAFVLYTNTGMPMWIAAVLMGLIGMGTTGLMITVFIKTLDRPELSTIGMGVLITFQGIGQFLGTFLIQWLLGPDLSNTFIAGLVIMVLGIIGTVCVAMCKVR